MKKIVTSLITTVGILGSTILFTGCVQLPPVPDAIVGTQRIWPARAFTLGHLTHNDLASVRIAKRATKSL